MTTTTTKAFATKHSRLSFLISGFVFILLLGYGALIYYQPLVAGIVALVIVGLAALVGFVYSLPHLIGLVVSWIDLGHAHWQSWSWDSHDLWDNDGSTRNGHNKYFPDCKE